MGLFNIFFNTTRESGKTLKQYKEIVVQQDFNVLKLFEKYPEDHLTSHEVEEMMGGSMVRSSVVRSINTLTNKGLIIKTPFKKRGKYGRDCYTWKYNKGL